MQAAGWRWDKLSLSWCVAERERAAPFAEYAVGPAKTRLDAFIKARHDAVSDSYALDAVLAVPAPEGKVYRPYQLAGISYMAARRNVLNADAPRLGKTIQTIGVINLGLPPVVPRDVKFRVLIVCPAGVKINWLREWKKWAVNNDLSCGIVSGSVNPDTDVLIINYDILNRHHDQLMVVEWDYVIFDEAHRLKNARSARTKYCIGNVDVPGEPTGGYRFKRARIFLTGTPIKTRPVDLWPLVRCCDPNGLGRRFWDFVQRYCDAQKVDGAWDFTGASNMEELQRRLRSTCMIRREKKDVVAEIPAIRETIVFPADGLNHLLIAERSAVGTHLAEFEAALANLEGSLDRFAPFDGIQRDENGVPEDVIMARQDLALAKLDMCFDHMDMLLENGEKLVVFAYHRAVVKKLHERFSKTHGSVMLIGGMGETARQAVIDAFNADDSNRVLVANIVSAGEGIDLSIANTACFVEVSWSPSELDQAEERIWAVTKDVPCAIYRYVVRDSMDHIMLRVVEDRQHNIALAMNRDNM